MRLFLILENQNLAELCGVIHVEPEAAAVSIPLCMNTFKQIGNGKRQGHPNRHTRTGKSRSVRHPLAGGKRSSWEGSENPQTESDIEESLRLVRCTV